MEKYEEIQIVLKVGGNNCNIDCEYCYEKQKGKSDAGYINEVDLRKYLLSFYPRRINVQLHGGEPLLIGIVKMKSIIKAIKAYPAEYSINIQTNGTLLTEEWLEFFEIECPEIEIGISIDGDVISNYYRRDKQRHNTFYDVDNVIKLCEARQKKIGIIAVVNSHSINREEEILRYFSSYSCIKMINFMPCIDLCGKELKQSWNTTSEEYCDFIKKVFLVWKQEKYYRYFMIDPIYSIICRLNGKKASLCHYNDQKCSYIYTLYPNGDVYCCDEFGFIENNISHIEKKVKNALKKCQSCRYFLVCTGGCIGAREREKESEEVYCNSKKELIDFICKQIGMMIPVETREKDDSHNSGKK